MSECENCNGTGKVRNPEWDKMYDRMENNYPSDELIRAQLGKALFV